MLDLYPNKGEMEHRTPKSKILSPMYFQSDRKSMSTSSCQKDRLQKDDQSQGEQDLKDKR